MHNTQHISASLQRAVEYCHGQRRPGANGWWEKLLKTFAIWSSEGVMHDARAPTVYLPRTRMIIQKKAACKSLAYFVPDSNRPYRFEFRAVPVGGSSRAEGGGKNCYTLHTGGPQHRRAKGSSKSSSSSSTTNKKRKRAPSTRRGGGPGKDRAGGGAVPSASAVSECSASMGSVSAVSYQV